MQGAVTDPALHVRIELWWSPAMALLYLVAVVIGFAAAPGIGAVT